MKDFLTIVLLGAFLFNQGCCSIFCSGTQPIAVNSKPEGADVKIGPYKGTTPYTVCMPRGKDYVVQGKYGDKTETIALNKSIEPIYWINILFWPGLLIDLGTGKMWKYEPTEYELSFN